MLHVTTLRPRRHHGGNLDLVAENAFFVALGLEVEGQEQLVEGEFLDAVYGIPGSRTKRSSC